MERSSDIPSSKRRRFGRARLAVLGLAGLLLTLILWPGAAPFIGTFAILMMLWGLGFAPFTEPDQRRSDYEQEPILWDDGFGAN